jgi:hypothetical protein
VPSRGASPLFASSGFFENVKIEERRDMLEIKSVKEMIVS